MACNTILLGAIKSDTCDAWKTALTACHIPPTTTVMTILIGDVATPKLRPDIEHIALPWALRDVTDEQEILKGALFLLKNLYAEGSDHTLIIAKSPYDIPSLQNALDKRESSERVGCAPWRTWTTCTRDRRRGCAQSA
jgi:hypothetical protein